MVEPFFVSKKCQWLSGAGSAGVLVVAWSIAADVQTKFAHHSNRKLVLASWEMDTDPAPCFVLVWREVATRRCDHHRYRWRALLDMVGEACIQGTLWDQVYVCVCWLQNGWGKLSYQFCGQRTLKL